MRDYLQNEVLKLRAEIDSLRQQFAASKEKITQLLEELLLTSENAAKAQAEAQKYREALLKLVSEAEARDILKAEKGNASECEH
jgi:uncharacterized coiled-coil DUF342 family protein